MAFAGCDSEEEDLEKMESDVKHMALKVSDYRKSLPVNLRNTFESVISDIDSESQVHVVSRSGAHLGTEDQESRDRYVQFKETVCGNVNTMPLVVKRMRECKESIDKSNSLNGTIHPAFTRRKAN